MSRSNRQAPPRPQAQPRLVEPDKTQKDKDKKPRKPPVRRALEDRIAATQTQLARLMEEKNRSKLPNTPEGKRAVRDIATVNKTIRLLEEYDEHSDSEETIRYAEEVMMTRECLRLLVAKIISSVTDE